MPIVAGSLLREIYKEVAGAWDLRKLEHSEVSVALKRWIL